MSKKKSGGANKDLFDGYDSAFDGSLSKGGKSHGYGRCYETHPTLQLGTGTLCGGSCSSPIHKDADVYIGLDSWMKFKKPHYPWASALLGGPEEVLFGISDQAAPSDEKNFVLMIDWLKGKLEAGKKVHVGCIGGHGRTGMVLAALVKVMLGEEDAIAYVRKHYCKKAVESKVQVKFLMKTFGIKDAPPTKEGYAGTFTSGSSKSWKDWDIPRVGPPAGDLDDYLGKYVGGGEYIPGTTITRSRGPRDFATVTANAPRLPKAVQGDAIEPNTKDKKLVVTGLPNSPNSVW